MVQRTLLFFKPDAMEFGKWPKIMAEIVEAGFNICGCKLVQPKRDQWEKHYHNLDPAIKGMVVDFMMQTPVMAFVIEGDEAVSNIRARMGGTNPNEAEEGTIRRRHGHASRSSLVSNVVHSSATAEEARVEIALWFHKGEIHDHRYLYTKYSYAGYEPAARGEERNGGRK